MGISSSLLCHGMDQHRALHLLGNAKKGDQLLCIMTVNRAQIHKAHALKDRSRHQHTADPIFNIVRKAIDITAAGKL